ncbi:MAG: PLP-dependent transferase [Armatimonadetes bacterium]|nr:PLP-dependent transferase [Armatimonadota bacterium]
MQTFLIHGRYRTEKWDYNHHVVPPISSSTTYRLESFERGAYGFEHFGSEEETVHPIYIYDRLDEPVRGMLEENLAHAEKGEYAVSFATGMAAISAILGVLLKAGDELVTHRTLYGCTYSLLTRWLPRFGISVRFCDMCDPGSLGETISRRTRAVYFETPVNPTMDLVDIGGVREVVDRATGERPGEDPLEIVVDNTFATPFCQRPLTLGADVVVHSLTKNIGGFGTDMGGAVITPKRHLEALLLFRKDFGGVLSPKSAWPILVYGLPTLALRLKQQQDSANLIARFLARHPKVAHVSYPGLGDGRMQTIAKRQMSDYHGNFAPGMMLYFTLSGDPGESARRCKQIVNFLAGQAYAVTLAVSLGQVRTLIENPVAMTHSAISSEDRARCGLDGSGLRLSVGLEDPKDIIEDLNRALARI